LPCFEEGAVAEGFANKGERMNVLPCRIERPAGRPLLRVLAHHGSADIVGTNTADGYLIVPRGVERVAAGQRLRFFTI
jgi:molybdopterin biosynthesis enzyme